MKYTFGFLFAALAAAGLAMILAPDPNQTQMVGTYLLSFVGLK